MVQRNVNLDALRERALQALEQSRIQTPGPAADHGGIDLTQLIEELRVYQAELEIQNQELNESQANLAAALEQYRALFEQLPLPGLLLDDRDFIALANQRAVAELGLSPNPALQRLSVFRLFDAASRTRLYSALRNAEAEQPAWLGELQLGPDDASRRPCDIHVIRLRDDLTRQGRTLLVIIDRSLEHQLRDTQMAHERYRLANLATTNVLWDWTPATGEHWWSQSLLDQFGHDPDELSPAYSSWSRLIHPEDRARVEEKLQQTLASHASTWFDRYRFQRKAGDYADVEDHGMIQRDSQGKPVRLYGALHDIGERLARQRLEEQLRQFTETVPGVVYIYRRTPDGRHDFPYLSPQVESIYGINAEAARENAAPLFAPIHPGDLPTLLDSIEESARTLSPWRQTYRIQHPRRGWVWIEALSRPRREPDGNIIWHGILFDVTARKETEAVARISQFALDNLMDAVLWVRPDSSIRYANPAAIAMLGYSGQQLGRMRVADLDPDCDDAYWQTLWNEVKRQKSLRFERANRTPTGDLRPVEISAHLLRLEDEEYLCAIVRDLTQRKDDERKIALAAHRYEKMLASSLDGFWLFDASTGRILETNEAYCRMIGYSRDEVRALSLGELDVDHTPEQAAERIRDMLARGWDRFETRHRTRDGRLIDLEVSTMVDEPPCIVVFIRDITPRKTAERAIRALNAELENRVAARTAELAQAEERLRLALEAGNIGVWQEFLPGRTLQGSDRFRAHLALPLGPAPSFEDFIDRIHPDDRAEVIAHVNRTLQTREDFSVNYRIPWPDGSTHWIQTHGRLYLDADGVPNRLGGVTLDITERKQREARLQQSEELARQRLEEIQGYYDHAPVGLCILDTRLRYIRINARLAEINGLPAHAHLGRRVREIVPDLADAAEALFHRVIANGEPILNVELSGETAAHPGIQRIWREQFYPLKDTAGAVIAINVVVEEITERKQAELELMTSERRYRELSAHLEQRVAERTAELTAANAAKSQFLAQMSHELRTPMNAILGFAQILEQDALSTEHKEMVGLIHESATQLLHIINDILDLAAIERGQLRFGLETFAPFELLRRIHRQLAPLASRKGIALRLDTPDDPGACHGCPKRLTQVLINLTGNAIKFTERGEVVIAAQTLPARARDVLWLRFEIRDTGIGIPAETLGRLFQPFIQGDASLSRRFGGTGLGLVISKQLVEAMGGRIGVSSSFGQGSTFWFELPFQREQLLIRETPADPPDEREHQPAQFPGMRVLVVDDNAINLRMIERVLKLRGVEVTMAGDGQQALATLRARPVAFDLVLMDIQMPVMDGLEATREIRRDPALAGLPVIALTAGVLPEERRAALAVGMNDFLAKPLDLKPLHELLGRFAAGAAGCT